MRLISRVEAVERIASTGGRIFTAVFVKKDGTTRTMNCRLGVSKGVKGVGLRYDPHGYGLLPVFDMEVREFRMLNVGSLLNLTVDGESYEVRR